LFDFLTGIEGKLKGYTCFPELKLTMNKSGRFVGNLRCGTGMGTPTSPSLFIDVELWDDAAKQAAELVNAAGLAVKADGKLQMDTWTYQGKRYTNLKLKYLKSLAIQTGEDEFTEIDVKRKGKFKDADDEPGDAGDSEESSGSETLFSEEQKEPVLAGKNGKNKK